MDSLHRRRPPSNPPDALDIAQDDPAAERHAWAVLTARYPWLSLPTQRGLPVIPNERRAELLALLCDTEMRDIIKALLCGEVDEISDDERGPR